MAFFDSRPPALDVPFRPGNSFSANLTWTPSLTGRTFVASCGNQTPSVAINGQVMAVTMTAAQTAALGLGRHLFALTETTGGISDDIIIGRWSGSDGPNDITSASATVTLSSGEISVTVLSVAANVSSLTATGAVNAGSLAVSGAASAGSLAVAGATTTNTLTVADDVVVRNVPLAQYERVTFLGDALRADPAFAATRGDTLNYPGWDFADGVTQAVQWPFAPPRIGVDGSTHLFWTTFSIALVWFNLGAGSGAVRWQIQVRNLAIALDPVNEAPSTDVSANVNAAGQNIINASVFATGIPVNPAFFGSEWSCRVARIGGDDGDTLLNAVRLGMVSFNRDT